VIWGGRADLERTDGRIWGGWTDERAAWFSPGRRAVIREGPAGRLAGQTTDVIWAVGFFSFFGIVRLQNSKESLEERWGGIGRFSNHFNFLLFADVSSGYWLTKNHWLLPLPYRRELSCVCIYV
jgi:hypothetical protein